MDFLLYIHPVKPVYISCKSIYSSIANNQIVESSEKNPVSQQHVQCNYEYQVMENIPFRHIRVILLPPIRIIKTMSRDHCVHFGSTSATSS